MSPGSTAAAPAGAPLSSPVAGRRRDYRPLALVFLVIAVAALGYLVDRLPGRGVDTSLTAPPQKRSSIKPDASPFAGIPESAAQVEREEEAAPPASATEAEVKALRKQARSLLAAKRFREAFAPLQKIIALAPGDAQAHLHLGLAIEGLGNFQLARRYYEAAIDRDPALPDAYFGYATASESLGDLEGALGAMRSFLHVQRDADPYRLRVAQARSAIWEWESKLGRGAWGPTKGVPPGFSPEELKRDGKGVGVKMPIPGTEGPDGVSKYEIKTADKIPMFKKQ
jgi:tetratricopeptide (TPR) repeat protein